MKEVIYSTKCMGDMTTFHLCMCFVQKSVFLITCPVQRDVLLSNYMHADVAKRDSVFVNFSMCKRSIYSTKCRWEEHNWFIVVFCICVLYRKHVFYNLLSISMCAVGMTHGRIDGDKIVVLA